MDLFLFIFCRSIVLTYQEHLGVTYIILNEDPCPRMVIHNKCPIPLMLKETVKGRKGHNSTLISYYLYTILLQYFVPVLLVFK